MKRVIFIVLSFFLASPVVMAMTSTNYTIGWDSVNSGGLDTSTSTNYSQYDTIGESMIGGSTSTNYELQAGYRSGTGGATSTRLSLLIRSQNTDTATAFSAFSSAGKTVTVASTSSYSAGDNISVIENKGYSQLVAVGKIVSISGDVITVDAWDGANGTMSALPSGGNDYVYSLSGQSMAFGTLSTSLPNTSVTMTSVDTEIASGYTVYVHVSQVLSTEEGQTIQSVDDGLIDGTEEEYGASVTGTYSYLPDIDMAVNTWQRVIQTRGAASTSPGDRSVMSFKLAITADTAPGSYSHAVYYTLTANY